MVLRELALDTDGDLLIQNGQIVFLEGAAAVAQRVAVRLRTLLGEWTFDTTLGTPWFQEIFAGRASEALVYQVISKRILETEDVESIETLNVSIDRATREVTVAGRVVASSDEVVEVPEVVI